MKRTNRYEWLVFVILLLITIPVVRHYQALHESRVQMDEVKAVLPDSIPPTPPADAPATSHPMYYYADKDGSNKKEVSHVMGRAPMQNAITMLGTHQQMMIDDDTLYNNLQWAVDQMGGEYQREWQGYLNQTTLMPDDPARNFFIRVVDKNSEEGGKTLAAFSPAGEGGLEITIRSDIGNDPDWSTMDQDFGLVMVSILIHEMRHLQDWRYHYSWLWPSNAEMLRRSRDLNRKHEFTQDDFETVMAAGAETVAAEMLAFNREYGWLKANHADAMPQWILLDPDDSATWKAWETGDIDKFARAVYKRYEETVWGNVPLNSVEGLDTKQNIEGIIYVAKHAYAECKPDPDLVE